MAQGFSQKAEIDFQETFSLTVKYDLLRLLFGLAAAEDPYIHQMDVEKAYLAGELVETLYMRPPEGLTPPPRPGQACRLLRSLYGLRQSGCIWNQKITAFFVSLGFKKLHADPSVLTNCKKGLIIAMYVDDLLLFSRRQGEILATKKTLAKAFKMKDLGEAKEVLNMRIERSNGIRIS